MPIVNVTTWPTAAEVKKKMAVEITRVIHEVTGAPLDKITVFIQEIEKHNWAEGGVFGDDPQFATQSRRLNYETV